MAGAGRHDVYRWRLTWAVVTGGLACCHSAKELMSGVAYAHLRAYPRIPVRVTRERAGWRFDG
ncbi:hypothetical protein AB0I50_32025, partial [Streptomyces prunicolor]